MSSKASFLIVLAAASIVLTLGVAGCKNNDVPDANAQSPTAQTDNLAPTNGTQTTSTNDQQQPAPPQQSSSGSAMQQGSQNQNYSNDDSNASYQDTSYGQPVLQAQQPPPALPEYSQPECPGDGYLWTPGYWSYTRQGYYWVPGVWALPPEVGYLWTPGYWGFVGGMYRYNYGSWGQYVGYYGGINYGFGYGGTGYQGGYWDRGRFNYNRSVNHVNITNVNVYNRNISNTTNNRTSYNGPGGITRRPLPAETAAMRGQRVPPMTTQLQHQQEAAQNRQQFASVNHGHPAVLAAMKPIHAGKPIAPVIPARTVAQPQQQRAQSQPQQHAQPQSRAQAQPQQHAQPQSRAQAQTQQHAQPQQRAQAQPQQRPAPEEKKK
jgi:hypothetical protein